MCPRMHQIAPFFFINFRGGGGGGGGGGGMPPDPPSMASRLLHSQENTSCFKYGEKYLYFVTC